MEHPMNGQTPLVTTVGAIVLAVYCKYKPNTHTTGFTTSTSWH